MLDEDFNENKVSKKHSVKKLLIITNVCTFLFAGFLVPKAEKKFLYKFNKNSYGEKKVMEVENFVRRNYLRDVNEENLINGKLKGVLASLEDPYSVYMTKDEFKELLEDTHGAFGGVGIVVGVNVEKDLIEIISPIDGTPGDKAGIKPGDFIIEINDKIFKGKDRDNAIKEMKGEPGTDVKIKVVRNLGKENQENKVFNITREEIRNPSIKGEFLIEDKIGYIRISSFDEMTFKDFKEEMQSLEKKGMEGLVIDLRNNPGGLLNITADIANLFLDKGDIVYTENRDGKRQYIHSDNKKVDYPLVVLINGYSASASEILSGALKDRKRATLIGTNTYGKGVVQRLVDLGDGTGLKLTISEYFTPNETKIDKIGVKPDIVLELSEGVEVIGVENLKEDIQLQKALEVIKSEIK